MHYFYTANLYKIRVYKSLKFEIIDVQVRVYQVFAKDSDSDLDSHDRIKDSDTNKFAGLRPELGPESKDPDLGP